VIECYKPYRRSIEHWFDGFPEERRRYAMTALPVDYPVRPLPARQGGAVVLPFPGHRVRRPAPAPQPRPTLRITRRGRLAITLALTVVLAALGFAGGSEALARGKAQPVPVRAVTVLPGDTLWSVADQVTPPGEDVRDVIAEIADLNGLESSAVYAGQQLTVPLAD
jgi:hypothetical protein